MNKDILIGNISKALKLLESEKDYAFKTLINNVSERIDFDQTLKIESVGVFQLKKEPLPRQERTGLPSAAKEKRTLIYSPPFESLEGDVNSVFLTIDLDDFNVSSADDINKTLSLSVNQPLMPMTSADEELEAEENRGYFDSDLERRIINMVEDGEILEDFDIWEEYLSRNPGASEPESTFYEEDDGSIDEMVKKAAQRFEESSDPFLEEEPVDIVPEESPEIPEPEKPAEIQKPSEEEEQPVDEFAKTVLDDELRAFEEIAQLEDTIDSDENDSLETPADSEETVEEHKEKPESPRDEYDELTGNILSNDKVDDILGSIEVDQDEEVDAVEEKELSTLDSLTDISEDDAEEEENKSMFDELEDYLKEDDPEETPEETETIDLPDEPEVTPETIVEEPEELETEEEIIAETRSEEKITEPFYFKKWFIIGVPGVIILVAVIFLLLSGGEPDQMVNNQPESVINNTEPAADNTASGTTKMTEGENDEALQTEKPAAQENTPPPPKHTGLYREIPNDSQVAKQIFFDGQEYTVQVSSWRSPATAELEVNRLKKAGHDAFIYQLYVKSLKGTWNRVRIGYFKSVDEASQFLANNKF